MSKRPPRRDRSTYSTGVLELPASHRAQEHVIRILIIGLNAAPERTGIAPYTSGMAERLSGRGDDVRLLTAFPHYPEWRFVEGAPPRTDESIEHGVRVTRLRHRLPARGNAVSRVLSELSFGLRALLWRWESPDAVVLVSPAMFASALLVPRLLLQRIPFTVWVQDLYGLGVQETAGGERPGLAGRLVGRLEGWMLRRADVVVVIHEQMSVAVQRLGVDADRVAVVRNWTHIETSPGVDRPALRAELGWRPDETVVLHTGNMGTKQDLRNVVHAARLADRRGAPVRFVLMGDGVERPLIEAAAEGVERVQLIPPQPDGRYEQMLQAADVLLVNEHPGVRGMAFPSKLTSYFTSGRPVIAATNEDSTTATELRAAEAGVRVAPGRPAELLDGVLALAADHRRMRALAAAGGRYRRAVLSVETAGRAFGRVLLGLSTGRLDAAEEPRTAAQLITTATGAIAIATQQVGSSTGSTTTATFTGSSAPRSQRQARPRMSAGIAAMPVENPGITPMGPLTPETPTD